MLRTALMRMLLLAGGLAAAHAQQTSDYVITDMPIGAMPSDSVLWVKWTGGLRTPPLATVPPPDSGTIYYDRFPGGTDISKYRYQVVAYTDTSVSPPSVKDNVHFSDTTPAMRGIAFRAKDQEDMGAGIFYCVVAHVTPTDTLYSNEFQIAIEHPVGVEVLAPSGDIEDLTPTFKWESNPGVPYYHVILSDEALAFSDSGETVDLEGLSIVWQAITPSTQIVYGAPDPSGTITAEPPPLSPGRDYTWIVLNNYGNHAAYTSPRIKLPSGSFSIVGDTLNVPVNVSPEGDSLNVLDNPTIDLSWTNLDWEANTYKVYLYVASDFEGIDARLVVWETEVTAGQFMDDSVQTEYDTASVTIDAQSVLTTNKYAWKVFAVDDKGAATAGPISEFHYEVPTGTMELYTKEYIVSGSDTLIGDVGLVEMQVEVLDGSLEAPLLFYTDNKGRMERDRPVGTYRVTAVKKGFESLSKTLVLTDGQTITDTFFLERPEATVFGQVVDKSGTGINLAGIVAVSDQDDTLKAETDPRGSFLLNCYGADWTIWATKNGYESSQPVSITVDPGESYDFGKDTLQRNPLTLSGTVENQKGEPLLGVNVKLYREGTVIDEAPSTPQSGTFSFTVTAGTYRVTASKTGFTTYSKSVDVTSSKQMTVAMSSGASVVAGYVYGHSWVGSQENYAPITNATITFYPLDTQAADTVSTESDATYGDFRISLPGGRQYVVRATADGYRGAESPDTLTTTGGQTHQFLDTLEAFAMISGYVRRSGTDEGAGGVSLSLLDSSEAIAGTGKSQASGYFELRGIDNGSFTIRAGTEGLVLDSVVPSDTAVITGGRVSADTFLVYMSPGDKDIRWVINKGADTTAAIKVRSPLNKTLNAGDTLKNVGHGTYVVVVDGRADSVVDLARHVFTVAETEEMHVDSVSLPVVHVATDSVSPAAGLVTLTLHSSTTLDSVTLYYKDHGSSTYRDTTLRAAAKKFTFDIAPPKDGSYLRYYFEAYRGTDVYGYGQETFATYVRPDTTRISKFEVKPSADDDTLVFPSSYTVSFSLKAYASSAFVPFTTIEDQSVTWDIASAQGCVLKNTEGLSVKVVTGARATAGPVKLIVRVDSTLTAGISPVDTVLFGVSGSVLDSIVVDRIDPDDPNPVTTSAESWAQFSATGLDSAGKTLALSPSWKMDPPDAGTLTADGIFRATSNFVGQVRIYAKAGDISGEYNPQPAGSDDPAGLSVLFMLASKDTPDTATTGEGCTVVFPANVVDGGDIGYLEVVSPYLRNQMERGLKSLSVVGSAYELRETQGVSLNLEKTDSIELILDFPPELQETVARDTERYYAARWDPDTLQWDTLTNSRVASDGSAVRVNLRHFSRYAAVSTGGSLGSTLEISPNPFSPRVSPDDGVHKGTCIKFRLDDNDATLQHAWVRIYNGLGDIVYSVKIPSAVKAKEYRLWWDGRMTDGKQILDGVSPIATSRMCRNGRYFLVLSVKNMEGKERHYTKPVVLLK